MIWLSFFFQLAKANWKVTGIAILVLIVGIAGCQYRSSLIEKGRKDAIEKIERDNKASEKKAGERQKTVDECPLGKWDREKHKCEV